MLLIANKLLPAAAMHNMSRLMLGIPKQGSMRDGAWPLTVGQRAMVTAAKVVPQPVMKRIADRMARKAAAQQAAEQESENNG
jgi:hypothetical protein